jgi:hypothetical protein
MTSRPASRILTVLVYAQVLLCLAGVASVLVRHGVVPSQVATEATVEGSGPAAVRI